MKEGNNIDKKTSDKCVHSYIAAIISEWIARGKVGKGIKYWYSSQKNLFRILRRILSVCKLFPLIYGTHIASCYSLNNKNISIHSLNSPSTLLCQFLAALSQTVSIESRGQRNDALIFYIISQDPPIHSDNLDLITRQLKSHHRSACIFPQM